MRRLASAVSLVALATTTLPVAGAAAAGAPRTVTQIAAAPATFGPIAISCADDLVTGTAEVTATDDTPVTLALLTRVDGTDVFVATDRTQTFTATPGTSRYPISLSIADLPLDVVEFQVLAATATDASRSNVIPALGCAPGEQIPEAPIALLLPLTMVAVGGVVVVLRRRATHSA